MALSTSYHILVRATQQFGKDNATEMGAALSYYALFSTAPLFVLAVMLASVIFGQEAARAAVRDNITTLVGPESAKEINAWMESAAAPSGGTLATIISVAVMLIGAIGVFVHIRQCLCVIWHLDLPKSNGVLAIVMNYFLSIVMVACVGLLLLLSLAVSTALPMVMRIMGSDFPGSAFLWHGLDALLSFALLTLFFALIFRVMSERRIDWGYVWYGSLVSALLFIVGKFLIGLYLAYASPASAYGAAGSLVAFLVWVYYSSLIFFFGAELVQARRTRAEWLKEDGTPTSSWQHVK